MAVLLGWPPRGTETMLWQGQRSFSLMVPSSPERNMAQGASRDPAVLTRPAWAAITDRKIEGRKAPAPVHEPIG